MITSQLFEGVNGTEQNRNIEGGEGFFLRLLRWREKHISERTFIVVLALIVGICSGLAAVLLKFLISTIAHALTSSVIATRGNLQYFIFPLIGILISGLYVRYLLRDNISHGVTRVLYAIAQKKSRLKFHNMYASLLASSVTIGFGGSVGAEGPIAFTGAAIGSNLGKAMRLPSHMMMMLVGCGAAAGIAGIFKAPIAGVLFTVEVLLLDLTAGSAIPLILSSVAGATVAYAFTGYNMEFFFSQSEPFFTRRIPYVIMLGVFCGFVSLYFTQVVDMCERTFGKIKNFWAKFAICGAILSLLIYTFPPLYGEGYDSVNSLLSGDVSALFNNSMFYGHRFEVVSCIVFVGALMLAKGFATAATNSGGGVGGTFAPSLYVGCMAGFFFAYSLNATGMVEGETLLSTKNFALMGMTGVMAGVMHAPLMAIFLTAEMTGGYELFFPLLIVSAVSYLTVRVFTPYGIYAKRLARRGELLTHEKDHSVLTLLKMNSVIETDFLPVTPEMSLKDLVDTISQSRRNLFPVIDKEGILMGVVVLDDIRDIIFRPDLYRRLHVSKLMSSPAAKLELGMPMEKVMKIFDDTGAWNLPVVEGERYVGFVSKSKIFNSYREVLKHYSYD